jgi:hypothetical protein
MLPCHRKFERRELAILEEWDSEGSGGKLMDSKELQKRLQVLRGWVVEHRERDRVARGTSSVYEKKMNRQNLQNQKHARDETSYKTHLKHQRVKDATQKRKGQAKKPVGSPDVSKRRNCMVPNLTPIAPRNNKKKPGEE